MSVPEDSELEAAGPVTLASGGFAPSAGAGAFGAGAAGVTAGAGSEAARESAFDASTAPRLRLESVDFEEDEDEEVLEVEPEPAEEEEEPPPNGFHAVLRHANLHNLLQIESLSRTTGVFLVLSGGSRGYLHLADGELVHAETGQKIGEAAAVEILSWEDGEFKSCSRTPAAVRTVHSSLQNLLLRMAQASDEAHVVRRHQASRVVRRSLDQEAPTETYLPPAVGRSFTPPPVPRPEPTSGTEVVLSAAGELIQGRGAATEELAARVAYAARLADLIGRAIRSGTPRALELRGKTTQTVVHWQADGNLSASLDLPVPSRR